MTGLSAVSYQRSAGSIRCSVDIVRNGAFWGPCCVIDSCSPRTRVIRHAGLPKAESKIWHRTAVWFLDGNPIVGYSVRKKGVQLLFWSGQTFEEPGLSPEGSFKAAEKYYADKSEIKSAELKRWLKKAAKIQWDYKNIVKRKGKLVRL